MGERGREGRAIRPPRHENTDKTEAEVFTSAFLYRWQKRSSHVYLHRSAIASSTENDFPVAD